VGRIVACCAVFLLALAVYAVPAVDTPFYTKGEAREALVVQTLHAGESLLLPLRNGDEIPSKPPMFHWLGATAAAFAGRVDETVVRVPSALAAAIALAALAWLVAQLYGIQAGLVAAGMLGTMVVWIVAATAARVDMVFSASIAIALISFFHAYRDGRRSMPQSFYACSAIAVLAKGPAGLVLPIAVVGAFLFFERDFSYFRKLRLRFALPWLALAAAWYVAAYFEGGDAFLEKHLFEENLYRVTNAEAAGMGHAKPFYAHLPLLLAGIAPWTIAVPAALLAYWERRSETKRGDPLRFFLVWFAVTFVLFSLAGSKRAVYLLPAYPAVAALLANWWVGGGAAWTSEQEAEADKGWRFTWKLLAVVLGIPPLVLFVQSTGLPVADWIAPLMSEGDRANLTAVVRFLDAHQAGVAIASGIALGGVVLFCLCARAGRRATAAAVAVAMCAGTIVAGSTAIQKEIARSQTVRPFIRDLVVRLHDAPLYSFGRVDYPAVFYAGQPIRRMDAISEGVDRARFVVLAQRPQVPLLENEADEMGRDVSELGEFTYSDNPRREPLVALLVERRQPADSPNP
jgi:4-amino-4-deoxy-L-arabinose transferase-like glycosyltransferase